MYKRPFLTCARHDMRTTYTSLTLGMPGWNLRDKKGCDFSGNNNENEGSYQPVQLLVLSDKIRDARSEDKLASEMGFDWDESPRSNVVSYELCIQYEVLTSLLLHLTLICLYLIAFISRIP